MRRQLESVRRPRSYQAIVNFPEGQSGSRNARSSRLVPVDDDAASFELKRCVRSGWEFWAVKVKNNLAAVDRHSGFAVAARRSTT
jgi:hypothetical protein